jgi:hypothetical protein
MPPGRMVSASIDPPGVGTPRPCKVLSTAPRVHVRVGAEPSLRRRARCRARWGRLHRILVGRVGPRAVRRGIDGLVTAVDGESDCSSRELRGRARRRSRRRDREAKTPRRAERLRSRASGRCGSGPGPRIAHGQGMAASISSASAVNSAACTSGIFLPLSAATDDLKSFMTVHADTMSGTERNTCAC